MIPKKEKSLVRIFDFERVFICEEPKHQNSIRFDGILKAMDALSLFYNSFFDKNNFNPLIPQQYERSTKIYYMMKQYILELLPLTSSFEYHADRRGGEQLDRKIYRLFNKWNPNAKRPSDQAKTLIDLNSDLAALYNENVLWFIGNEKTFLQYIMYLKGKRLELSLK